MAGLEMGTDGILRCRSGTDCPNIITAKEYKAVVERLKKRIEICKLPKNNEDQEVLEALQKILGEENETD